MLKALISNLCSVRPSIILFWQKVFCEKLPCPNFVCDTLIQIPRLLGAFLYEAFPLANDYTCTASFLVRVLRHNMHHIDLNDLQAGLPRSCVYPYVPIVQLGSKGSTSAIVVIGSSEPDLRLGEAES